MRHWLERISPHLNTLWRGEWPGHFIEPARYLYDHELVLAMQGKFILQIENEKYEMEQGSFALIPPLTNHVSRASRRSVFRSCIHFDWINSAIGRRPICSYFPKKPASRHAVKAPPFIPIHHHVGRFDPKGAVPALLETIFARWQNRDTFHRALCRGAFLELLVQLLHAKSKTRKPQDQSTKLAYAAKECLDFQSQEGAGIQALFSSLECSYAHASRLFHKNFGLTPVEYLNAQKLERAKTLLRNPRLSIAEVAYQSGFHDPGYFTLKFRRQTGLTPKRYRQSIP